MPEPAFARPRLRLILRVGLRTVLLGVSVLTCASAWALQPGVREQELSQCLPGEATHWGDGRDRAAPLGQVRLVYRHAGAPPWFSDLQVRARVQQAAIAWAPCGVPVVVVPEDAEGSRDARKQADDGTVLVHWPADGQAATFGLARLAQRRLDLGRGAFELLRQRNPAYPALDVLQMVVAHEMGHFFGLMSHSSRCVDVMSYYTNAQGQSCKTRDGQDHRRLPEYRALLPTACDIQRCRAVNGFLP